MNIKDRLNLSTDKGTNVLATLTPVLTYVLGLPEGWVKQVLVAMCIVSITASLYLIKGDAVVEVNNTEALDDVLKEGRE